MSKIIRWKYSITYESDLRAPYTITGEIFSRYRHSVMRIANKDARSKAKGVRLPGWKSVVLLIQEMEDE